MLNFSNQENTISTANVDRAPVAETTKAAYDQIKENSKVYSEQIKRSKVIVEKKVKKNHHVAVQATILMLIGVLFIANSSQPTTPSVSYRSGFGGAIQNSTIDEVSSAGVAATIARSGNLIISDNVTNLADSLNAQVDFAATYDSYLDKPQIVATNTKTRQDIITYTTKEGDTISSIANQFNITSDTIRWANDLRGNLVGVDKELTIPPVSGVIHEVAESDTPESLAKRYRASEVQIIAFNDAEIEGLPVGEKVIIPEGIKPSVQQSVSQTGSGRIAYSFGNEALYGGNGYSYGYCTWHVANRRAEIGRPIPRNLGHAVTWATLASQSGFTVSEEPIAGAVLWHKNTSIARGYGHVAFVEQINPDGSAYISDMNWAGWNVLTYRTLQPDEFDEYLFVH